MNVADEVAFGAIAAGAALTGCAVALWMAGWANERLGAELAASVVAAALSGAFGFVVGRGQTQLSRAGVICLHVLLFWLEGTLLSRMLPARIHMATFCASALRMLALLSAPSFTLQRHAARKSHDS